VLGATPHHLRCVDPQTHRVVALDLDLGVDLGASTNAVQLLGAPIAGVATAAGEVAFRLRDGSVGVLAIEGISLQIERIIDVHRAPREIIPVATTRRDWHHMEFLLDGTERPADERPVVFVAKDSPPAHVVAPDLPSFLGLVALGGADWIERDREPTRIAAEEDPAPPSAVAPDDPAAPRPAAWHATSFHDASRCLAMIDGVARPARWSDVTEAIADRSFTYSE
jgi:hypothetical protein